MNGQQNMKLYGCHQNKNQLIFLFKSRCPVFPVVERLHSGFLFSINTNHSFCQTENGSTYGILFFFPFVAGLLFYHRWPPAFVAINEATLKQINIPKIKVLELSQDLHLQDLIKQSFVASFKSNTSFNTSLHLTDKYSGPQVRRWTFRLETSKRYKYCCYDYYFFQEWVI